MGLYDMPDHPVIRNCELTGYPDGKTPSWPRCPVCGDECSEIYYDKDGDIIGCDCCARVARHGEDVVCPICGNPVAFLLYAPQGGSEDRACDDCVRTESAWDVGECFPDDDR